MLAHRTAVKYQRFIILLALVAAGAWPLWSQNKDGFFETKVRPILATECFSWHTDSQVGGLRLDVATCSDLVSIVDLAVRGSIGIHVANERLGDRDVRT